MSEYDPLGGIFCIGEPETPEESWRASLPTLAEAMEISREMSLLGGDAEAQLCAKCNWERMTRIAVIMEWGDPRTWD